MSLKCPSWQRKRGVMCDIARPCGTLVSLGTAKAGVRDDITCPLSVPRGSESGGSCMTSRVSVVPRDSESGGQG